jgi:hypothetical protein
MKKRKAVLIIITLLLVALASGCSGKSDYEVYMEAAERTENVARGKSEMAMNMKLKFNEEGLPREVSEGLEMFGDMTFEIRNEYDKEKEESLNKIFIKAKDTGFDAKVYTKGDVGYVITPLIPKIVVIKGGEFVHPDLAPGDAEEMPNLSEESLEAIEKVWKSLYSNDNVSALERIVMDTPGGSVKATRYEVNITDEQLKPAIRKTMEIALGDSAFMEGVDDMMRSAMEEYAKDRAGMEELPAEEFSFEEAFRANMDAVESSTVKTFSQTAFIDRDNYIIEERLAIDILYHFTEGGTPQSFSMEMTIKNWGLNRQQEIYFPEVTAENSITLEELEDEYKDGLNLFKGETD